MAVTGVHQPGSGRPQGAKHPGSPRKVEPSKPAQGKPRRIAAEAGIERATARIQGMNRASAAIEARGDSHARAAFEG